MVLSQNQRFNGKATSGGAATSRPIRPWSSVTFSNPAGVATVTGQQS
jgi:hypothetical protein